MILAPNVAMHTPNSMIDWILEMSSDCGNGGSYFVYGRFDASALAMTFVLRECAATAAVALVSPLHELSRSLFTAHMIEHELVMVVAAAQADDFEAGIHEMGYLTSRSDLA